MSDLVNPCMFTGGDGVEKEICPPNETETFKKKEESLQTKRKEFLERKIEQVHKSSVHKDDQQHKRKRDMVNKLDDLMKESEDEHNEILEMAACAYQSLSLGLEFYEGELLAELEQLEKNLDPSLAEKENMEEKVSYLEESSTASLSLLAKTEEEEKEQLEYLRRWANDSP